MSFSRAVHCAAVGAAVSISPTSTGAKSAAGASRAPAPAPAPAAGVRADISSIEARTACHRVAMYALCLMRSASSLATAAPSSSRTACTSRPELLSLSNVEPVCVCVGEICCKAQASVDRGTMGGAYFAGCVLLVLAAAPSLLLCGWMRCVRVSTRKIGQTNPSGGTLVPHTHTQGWQCTTVYLLPFCVCYKHEQHRDYPLLQTKEKPLVDLPWLLLSTHLFDWCCCC